MKQGREQLKSLFSAGKFDAAFIEAAKRELPYLWGRLSLLEEFYSHNAPGVDERSRQLHDQLGTPKQFHGSALRRLWAALTG